MITIVKTLSSEFDNLKRRIIKVLRFGKSDVQTSKEIGPFGIDSNPLEGMYAIHAETGTKGKTVIIGYIKPDQLAAVGEMRMYSTDANGALKTYTWLKNDGTIEVGGSDDFMVRYSKLEEAFNELKGKFNSFAAAYTPGSSSSVGTPPTISQSTADITQAKITSIKTKASD